MRDVRDQAILQHLRSSRAATVSELAQATGSSIATIRRDLQRLDHAGLLKRTHGGAVVSDGDAPFGAVESVNRDAKERIARAAAESVHDGQTIILDIGTTTLRLAQLLRGRRVTVITPNMAVYEVLRDEREVHLVLLPGDYDRVYRSVSGFLTTESLRLIRADQAFLGVSGITEDGDLRDTTLAQVPIKQAMVAACDRATVLADHDKFPGTGAGRIDLPRALRRVITDAPLPGPTAEAFARHDVEVAIV
ncbi:DeoR family transcriptional regulator [Agromyces sp. CFH 90414]|uniref:DeoR family transcriptional regulator n=1 Tax=Agromyces agglutinans TaxID=2662258 RepID=A0A6I2F7L8_9MICO|nr:DeoR/GlpR family DNA-binding transcription regulator [Agromyces agglutinans]MRG58770.1 DeoR family transcriptional regulator [Agromyces agglutinans]